MSRGLILGEGRDVAQALVSRGLILGEGRDVAQALGGRGLTGTGEQRVDTR